ncbi:plantaricin C family lantibiotic [Kitasatospora cathayae]|uniref:Plantaricin C family lantibiotic n=1 Tax=Kitasatospora cathayae TaxID=3004092 RepID=A0ABY7QEG9_9ACTN|nr:plantaricin C family lantibiotic [Kitasatospora sp. HUAS 3-15]WBP90639.1 plantaricin C family lantibiotic [Kitasatospora sp. HUAS 3-15]
MTAAATLAPERSEQGPPESRNEPTAMRNPNVDILEEISEQDLDGLSAGTFTGPIEVLTYTAASWAMGNNGYLCTVTAECQKNCQH